MVYCSQVATMTRIEPSWNHKLGVSSRSCTWVQWSKHSGIPRNVSRELDCNWSSWDFKWHSHGMQALPMEAWSGRPQCWPHVSAFCSFSLLQLCYRRFPFSLKHILHLSHFYLAIVLVPLRCGNRVTRAGYSINYGNALLTVLETKSESNIRAGLFTSRSCLADLWGQADFTWQRW